MTPRFVATVPAWYEGDGGRPRHVGRAGGLDSSGRLKKTGARLSAAALSSTREGRLSTGERSPQRFPTWQEPRWERSWCRLVCFSRDRVRRSAPYACRPNRSESTPGARRTYGGIEKPQVK